MDGDRSSACSAAASPALVNALVTVRFGLPAFVATLGMFYTARGIAAWIVSGRELFGFPESFNLIGRKLIEALRYLDVAPEPDTFLFKMPRRSACRASSWRCWRSSPASSSATRSGASRSTRPAATSAPPAYAGINTNRVRALSLIFSALCGACRRCHLHRLLPQLRPDRRAVPRARRHRLGHHRRRLDFRRLRHDHRLARRRRGDHSTARAPVAAGHQRRRIVLRAAPALGQCVHRADPDHRRAGRHLDAAVQSARQPSSKSCSPAMPLTRRTANA